jgi:coenzyme F420-reducing hydrogenase gamma subunit
LTPLYDVERFGVINTGNPKHADILLITGSVNHQNAPVVRQIYEQMNEPKVVCAIGVCACNGGVFKDCYNVLGGVLFTFAQKNKLNHEVASINRQISEAQSESTRLNSQLDALVSVEMIDQYAVEKLGMSKMQSGQMRYVDVDAYMQARAKAQKTQPSPGAYAHVVRE